MKLLHIDNKNNNHKNNNNIAFYKLFFYLFIQLIANNIILSKSLFLNIWEGFSKKKIYIYIYIYTCIVKNSTFICNHIIISKTFSSFFWKKEKIYIFIYISHINEYVHTKKKKIIYTYIIKLKIINTILII